MLPARNVFEILGIAFLKIEKRIHSGFDLPDPAALAVVLPDPANRFRVDLAVCLDQYPGFAQMAGIVDVVFARRHSYLVGTGIAAEAPALILVADLLIRPAEGPGLAGVVVGVDFPVGAQVAIVVVAPSRLHRHHWAVRFPPFHFLLHFHRPELGL